MIRSNRKFLNWTARVLKILADLHQTPRQSYRITATILSAFYLTGCATTATTGTKPAAVSWAQSLSAQLAIEKKSSNYKIKSEINIINDHTVRLDLTTTLDLPLASVILTDNSIEYLLYRDKKYYSGKPGPHALDPVFPMAIDVKRLINLLNEQKNPEDKCDSDESGLTLCSGMAGQTAYIVSWSKRKSSGPLAGRASKIVLELPQRQVTLKFYFSDWQKNISNAERLLTLNVPEGYKNLPVPER